jgi:rubrerythrin
MTNQVESVLEALEEAKCVEQEGQEFYRKAADQTKSQKGQELFRSLIREEVMHERLIQRQIDSLTSEGKWIGLTEAQGATCDLNEDIFPQGREGLEKAVKADTTDTEALIMAMEFETKAYDKFRQEAKAATDPAAQKMYEFLASQERTHFDLLMANYEAMVHYGGWAD